MIENILAMSTTAVAFLVMALLTKHKRYAWLVSIGNQGQWLLLGWYTGVEGFYFSAAAFGSLAIYGWLNWGKHDSNRGTLHEGDVEPNDVPRGAQQGVCVLRQTRD